MPAARCRSISGQTFLLSKKKVRHFCTDMMCLSRHPGYLYGCKLNDACLNASSESHRRASVPATVRETGTPLASPQVCVIKFRLLIDTGRSQTETEEASWGGWSDRADVAHGWTEHGMEKDEMTCRVVSFRPVFAPYFSVRRMHTTQGLVAPCCWVGGRPCGRLVQLS
jgi:hypothetical protein